MEKARRAAADAAATRLTEYELDCQTLYAVPRPPRNALRFAAYCGPTAVSAVTGDCPVKSAQLLKLGMKARGVSRVVAGTYPTVCIEVLREHYGAHCSDTQWPHRARGLRHFMGHFNGLSLVMVTGHFVAVLGEMIVDTACRYPTHIDAAPKRLQNKRVLRWWSVEF